jgi:8-oxo-dGTP pyrophosphatase MutT (NUDIX family)
MKKMRRPVMPKLNAAFWKWFGDSVVRNDDGSPKVVYHGTCANFDAFMRGRKCVGGAIFFGDSSEANAYAGPAKGASVYPVYLRIRKLWDYENPLSLSALAEYLGLDSDERAELDHGTDAYTPNQGLYWSAIRGNYDGIESPEFQKFIKEGGYDGFTLNQYGGAKNYAVFDPAQIKSAIGNDGTWDRDDPNISSNPPVRQIPVSSFPDDFQVLLGELLDDHGIPQVESVPVKTVAASRYLKQADSWGYGSGDERQDPQYLDDLKSYISSGGSMPPIVIQGKKLIDGRHRLLATRPKKIDAINLDDLASSNPPPKRFWGKAGAGILFHCTDDDTYLLTLRSQDVEQPGTLGIPGGACGEEGMFTGKEGRQIGEAQAWVCAMRETKEELGWWPKQKQVAQVVLFQKANFQYQTFIVDIPASEKAEAEKSIKLNWENDNHVWMSLAEMVAAREQLHFGMQHVLEQINA